MFALVIIGYALLGIYEFVPLYKQKLWHDFWVNTVIGIFSFAIALLLSFDVRIPSPIKPITEIITSIFGK
jgi:uncharacterized membrane protein